MLEMTRAHALWPRPGRGRRQNPHGGQRCSDSTTPSSPAQGCAGREGALEPAPQHPCSHSCLGLRGGGLQPRGRLSEDPLSPHEASPSSLFLGVPVGGGGVGLFSTPRGPGTGQGQAHPCHSPGLCTDVTLSQSLATTRQPGTHAPHSAPWCGASSLLVHSPCLLSPLLQREFAWSGRCLPSSPSSPLRPPRHRPPRGWPADGKKEGGTDGRTDEQKEGGTDRRMAKPLCPLPARAPSAPGDPASPPPDPSQCSARRPPPPRLRTPPPRSHHSGAATIL